MATLLDSADLEHSVFSGSSVALEWLLVFNFFLVYAIKWSQCPPFAPVPQPPLPTANPLTVVHVHGSCLYVLVQPLRLRPASPCLPLPSQPPVCGTRLL